MPLTRIFPVRYLKGALFHEVHSSSLGTACLRCSGTAVVSALAAADLTLTAPTEAVPGGSRSYFTITSPTPGFLTMTLDDASGTEVALLFDMEEIHTNENQLVFSAVDEDGSPLPTGSYSVSGELLDNSASPSETSAVHSPSPRRLLSRLTSTMRTIRRMTPKTPVPRPSPLTKNPTQRIRRTNSPLLKSPPFSPARLPPAISSTPHLPISRSVKKGIKSASASAIRFLRTTQAIGLWMLPPAMRKSGLL